MTAITIASSSLISSQNYLERTLIVIDTAVHDYQLLLAGIEIGVQIIVIDSQQDAITQISAFLKQQPIDSLQIIAHGSSGSLQLGNTTLNLDNLHTYQAQLQQWQVKEILIYACEVAAGKTGQAFLNRLHQLTWANIAASIEKVGSSQQGGSWELGVRIGNTSSNLGIKPEVKKKFPHLLAFPNPDVIIDSNFLAFLTRVDISLNGSEQTDTITGSINRTPQSVYKFLSGEGLKLSTSGTSSYSLELIFKFDNIASYRKIVDFSNRALDTGLYVSDGQLLFYPFTSAVGTINAGEYNHLILTRSSAGLVEVYLNGQKVFSFSDTSNAAVINGANGLNFFIDDLATTSEQTSGYLDIVSLWTNTTLSSSEVLSRYNSFSPVSPIQGTSAKDVLNGTANDDTINGLDSNDYINGKAGNDTLNGGSDTDYISGGDGNDTINGDEGNDFLYGNAGNDDLSGGDGGDNLDGGAGDDTLAGGIGNDIYTVDSINDQVIEVDGEGTDKINSSITWDLNNSANVENLTLTGNNTIDGTGNALNNHIIGNNAVNTLNGGDGDDWLMGKGGNDFLFGGEGNDRLDGGTGNDSLDGGAGNDQYEVDSLGDVIIEAADAGTDTVFSLITWTLGANLENLTLVGTQTIDGLGNGLDNQINGNSADNTLEGLAGNDKLLGGAGDDVLIGGTGFDRLEGGRGADIFDLTGVYTSGWDTVVDFKVGEDIIHLDALEFGLGSGTLNTSLFTSGIKATNATQRFIYNQAKGELFFDVDGVGDTEQVKIAQFSNRPILNAENFVLVSNVISGVIINQSNGVTGVTEGGATDTYSIVLNSQPTANVTININSGLQLATSSNQLFFTPQNWNIAQSVTVTAIDDSVIEGNHSVIIQHTVTSSDSNYNGITVDPVNVGITDNDLTPLALARVGNTDVFTISNSEPKARLEVNLVNTNAFNANGSAFSVDEMGLFIVDDAEGRINGLLPGEAGYTQAALDRAQVLLSGVPSFPGQDSNNFQRLVELDSGANFRFYLVRNSSLDNVLQGNVSTANVLFGTPSNQTITNLASNEFFIGWEDGTGAVDFQDLVVTIQPTAQPTTTGTELQTKPQGEILDLRAFTGQIAADFTVSRDSLYNNYVGFYRVVNENGGIDVNSDGIADVNPGDVNYIQQAISTRVAGIDLTVNTTPGIATSPGFFQGGAMYAPFIIANGRPDALLDANTANDSPVYFSYLGANLGARDHLRLLGDNYFGFEDLPLGMADFDFNDFTVKVNLLAGVN